MSARIDKEGVRVSLVTPWNRIEGQHHLVPGLRVSDSVNSDAAARQRYLPLTDAVVRSGNGEVLFRARFLMVAHAHIVCMTPVSELCADDAASATLSGAEAQALAQDMDRLLRA